MTDIRTNFGGSIPAYYDECLGPAFFDACGAELVKTVPARAPGDVLEIACGTGLVTRKLRERLDPDVRLVATDLSKAMIDYARTKLARHDGIAWREADAANLPFGDGEFGAVVCAFGIMFVPDKLQAVREVRRVLHDGGLVRMSVWDAIETNPHALACAEAIEGFFPGDEQVRFRIPYEMHDPALLRSLLADAGFSDVRIDVARVALDRASARTIAIGAVRGTPRSALIEGRGVALDDVIDKVTEALERVGGSDPYRGYAQMVIAQARRAVT
jgi:SAM-dependent methyltransferase